MMIILSVMDTARACKILLIVFCQITELHAAPNTDFLTVFSCEYSSLNTISIICSFAFGDMLILI